MFTRGLNGTAVAMIVNNNTGESTPDPILRYDTEATPNETNTLVKNAMNPGGKLVSAVAPRGTEYELIPPSLTSKRERDVYFLSGRGGAGKSYLSASLMTFYRKCKKRVFVITDIPDPKFGDCHYLDIHTLVGVNSTFEEEKRLYEAAKIKFKYRKKQLEDEDDVMALEIALHQMKPDPSKKTQMELRLSQEKLNTLFQDSVVLFDDYENNKDAKLIGYLRDHLLTKGRHSNTSLIICNHLTNFRSDSRLIMGETSNFVLFKKNTAYSRSYFMKTYLEFTPTQIKIAQNSFKNSRWLCIDRDLDITITQQAAWAD